MALRRATPVTIKPRGVTDSVDGTNAFPGSMAALGNLISAPHTAQVFVPRPAATQLTDFTGFVMPAGITALLQIGNIAYGMISSALNAGKDQPFCYDIDAGTFIAIGGITALNTPTTQPTSGDWTPPTMAVIATQIIVTHPGFSGAPGDFFGIIDITNPALPAWSSANTGGTALTAVPRAVAQFNNRAWYAVDNTVVYSDALNPDNVTSATQSLTLGDTTDVTALGGLGLTNQLGGIVQSLICFKGAGNMFQITGDIATTNLLVNSMNIATGTLAPRTVTPTPVGLAFVSPDGLRIVSFDGIVSEPIGINGQGVAQPFIFAVAPSRMAAAFNQNVLRISVQNGYATNNPQEEYWYHLNLKIWTGPHTFPAAAIQPYPAGNNGGFIMAAQGITAKLWQSTVLPTAASTYIENGSTLAWAYTTTLLPDNGAMAENAVIESSIGLSLAPQQSLTIIAIDDSGSNLDQVSIANSQSQGSIWGSFVWGVGLWTAPLFAFKQWQIPWSVPLVFKQAQMRITGTSIAGFAVGNFYMRYQTLGYMMPPNAA